MKSIKTAFPKRIVNVLYIFQLAFLTRCDSLRELQQSTRDAERCAYNAGFDQQACLNLQTRVVLRSAHQITVEGHSREKKESIALTLQRIKNEVDKFKLNGEAECRQDTLIKSYPQAVAKQDDILWFCKLTAEKA
jgi:hypothetical protein